MSGATPLPERPFSTTMNPNDLVMVTRGWRRLNRRRGELIRMKIEQGLNQGECSELENLQRLADLRAQLVDSFGGDWSKVARFWRELNRRRLELIDRESSGEGRGQQETDELENLQRLAGLRRGLISPLPWHILDALENLIKQGK